jgi:hypothetical protein
MATGAPARPQEVKLRREMQEAKAPEQFQFTKVGQTIEAKLISIEPVLVKGKEALEYLLEPQPGSRLTCLGTADLNKKIHPGHIDHWLVIRYERDDSSFQKENQSPMKIFKVLVSKEKEPGY